MSIAEVNNAETHLSVRCLHGQTVRPVPTCGDGACSIHSVFGSNSGGVYLKENPRAFLRMLFGSSGETFFQTLADAELYGELEGILWKDLVKPCAEHAAGIRRGIAHRRPEGEMIWRELVRMAPHVAQQCVEAIKSERLHYD